MNGAAYDRMIQERFGDKSVELAPLRAEMRAMYRKIAAFQNCYKELEKEYIRGLCRLAEKKRRR